MRIKIQNLSGHSAFVVCNEITYKFNSENFIYIETDNSNLDLYVKMTAPSNVHINLLDLFFQMLSGSGTVTMVNCDYNFTLNTAENCEVVLKENRLSPKEQYMYSSFCAVSETADISNESYVITALEKIKKKHRLIHTCLLSAIPIEITLIVFALIFMDSILSMLIPIVLLILLFTIPSLRQLKVFKNRVHAQYVNDILIKNNKILRSSKTISDEGEKSRFDNIIEKVMKKMFK